MFFLSCTNASYECHDTYVYICIYVCDTSVTILSWYLKVYSYMLLTNCASVIFEFFSV